MYIVSSKGRILQKHTIFMNKVKLNVLGISYSQTQSGAYALVLSEEEGKRRIPIIIGGFEAQAIAIQLEGLTPPRPLTHDLFLNFAKSFGIEILDVQIYKLEEGVFFSKLRCNNEGKEIFIDARTSDSIALALRFGCPIFTSNDIINRAGIVLDVEETETDAPSKEEDISTRDSELEALKQLSTEELNMLDRKSVV